MKKPPKLNTLQAALELAKNGYSVFPCKPDKTPYVKWKTEATTDAKIISDWWVTFPDAMIGLPTGEKNGLFVVDLDVDKNSGDKLGETSIENLGIDLSEAPTSHTPSGGRHHFFKHQEGLKNSAKAIGPGIDTRGEGGYVVASGSCNESGCYQWDGPSILDGEIPDIPVEIVHALSRKTNGQVSAPGGPDRSIQAPAINKPERPSNEQIGKHLSKQLAGVESAAKGERNQSLNKAAFSLGEYVGFGWLDYNNATAKLLSATEKCGLNCEEASATIKSGIQSGIAKACPTSSFEVNGASLGQSSEITDEGPQPLVRETPKGKPYPVAALGPLRQVVEAVQDKTQAPIAVAAQSALSVASLAVQGFADVETLGGYAPCSLFCLTIAQSGERKSACDKLLMHGVREYEADAAAEYRTRYANYDTDQKLWDARRNRLMKGAAGDGEKAKDAKRNLDDLPPAPEPPLSPNRTATEPTFEGLVKLFGIGHPSLGLFTDEGGSFMGGHAMNSDNRLKTCAGLSNFWDGTPINRTRAGDGASTMRGRRLASHMMVQPVAARPLLADPVASGQGFLARFLICEPESTIGHRLSRVFRPESDTAIAAFSAKLRTLLETGLPLREGTQNELEPYSLELSTEARELLLEYYDHTERAQSDGGSMAHIRPYASKSAEQAARIAGVLTLWKNKDAKAVNAEAMANGIALARYYLLEARRLADAAVISEKIEEAELLRKWLMHTWFEPEVLLSDVMQKGPNSLRESPKAKAAIAILKNHGWLVPLPVGAEVRGKHRKAAYRVIRPDIPV